MSTPFFLVALFPHFASKMPKSGPWLNWLKKIISLVLLVTSLWLLSVIKHQASATTAFIIGFLMILIITLLLARKFMPFRFLLVFKMSICTIIICALLTPLHLAVPKSGVEQNNNSVMAGWELFDPEKITKFVRAGNVVFVDITAEWCITCQLNKSRVLQTDEVIELLNGPNVVKVRGDWTKPEDSIANYLAKFKRFGVPLNVIYGPNFTKGILLPEILSKESMLLGFKKTGFKFNASTKNQNLLVTGASSKNLPLLLNNRITY
jgi:suppressor for copper-sensitivity B